MNKTQIKKQLGTVLFLISILGSNNANAVVATEATQLANVIQSTLTAVKSAATAASTKIIEVKTTLMEAWNKSAWIQQAKDMIKTIQEINDAKEKLTSEITGIRNAIANFNPVDINPVNVKDTIDYRYADSLPEKYTPVIVCDSDNKCKAAGPSTGYVGKAAAINSKNIRDAWRVDESSVGKEFLTGIGDDIQKIANEAAEKNAQEIAVIQAMASEAYVEANNRIKKIEELQDKIANPPAGEANDLKYTADLQAQIQTQQAYYANEQSKLSALAILQQSQRDAYEQRKKEIASYIKTGDRDASLIQSTERTAIALGTTAAYATLNGLYTLGSGN